MIEVCVIRCWKEHRKAEWQRTGFSEKTIFRNLKEAKAWVKEQYQGYTRQRMYRDLHDGTTIYCGYVYTYKIDDGYMQDWVDFKHINPVDLSRER